MTPNEYQELASRTECDQAKSRYRMSFPYILKPPILHHQDNEHLWVIRLNHSVIGLMGEAGELASLLQKLVYYGKYDSETESERRQKLEELKMKLKEEFGDVLWYVAEGLSALGLQMEDVMETNVRKLRVRYPDKYTQESALNRDLMAEEEVLREKGDIPQHLKHQEDDPPPDVD